MLLINLQGTTTAYDNVGVWELLTIERVDGQTMTFTSGKTRTYGATAGMDDGLGTGESDQNVVLVRVPRFGALTIAEGTALTAAQWNGQVGGTLALHAASLTIAGESISGRGQPGTARNVGGSGGLSAVSNLLFHDDTPTCATAGHAEPGEPGFNPVGRTLGEPGAAYGVADARKLTMGSGPGGGLTCSYEVDAPMLVEHSEARGGGIIVLLADKITVADPGTVSASPREAVRDVAASGGYVLLRGRDIAPSKRSRKTRRSLLR